MSEQESENIQNRPNKRKKRKNFISNAKKYAKKGQLGRGTKMPQELYQYFLGILEALKQGIDDDEARKALVDNVLDRTKGEELNVIGNQLGCRVVEFLLPFSSPEDLERFMEVISPELRRLCSDNFTSHIVETMLTVSCERAIAHLQNEDSVSETEDEIPKKKLKLEKKERPKYKKKHRKACYDFTIKICKYALNNLESFVWDSYANHILRSALKCLSGITLLPFEEPKINILIESTKENKKIPPHSHKFNYKNVPEEFKEIVKEFANRLSAWPQFKDLPYQSLTSVLLQVLLFAVKNVDKNLTRDLIKKLLNESFAPEDWVSTGDDDEKKEKEQIVTDDKEMSNVEVNGASSNLPPVFESVYAVRLLEAALFVAKKKTYTQLYARCFINRLAQLSTMPIHNFAVQRLIDNCQVKEEFESIFDELSNNFGALLACGNTGVLVALVKACLRHKSRQTKFVQNLEAALNCNDQENRKYFPVLCLRLLPIDQVDLDKLDKEYYINVHGSIILRNILEFQRPTKAVTGLLELTPEQLMVILTDSKACRIASAFCKGQFVGVKARDKLIWKLKGHYQSLVLSQHGSRAFEHIFEAASLEQKVKLMTELADKSNKLNGTPSGRLIASKLDLAKFKLSAKNWEQAWKRKGDNK